MSLKETLEELITLLEQLTIDAYKAPKNQAATQRVRTGTIRLEKLAKIFRKESIREHQAKKEAAATVSLKSKKSKAKPKAIKKKKV
jgi:Histone H1-like protein Hc1